MLMDEKLFPLVKAVECATGQRPHLATVLRWTMKPNRHGLLLESVFLGGRRLTSVEAVRRFIDSTSAARNCCTATPIETPRQQQRKAEKAAARLKEVLRN